MRKIAGSVIIATLVLFVIVQTTAKTKPLGKTPVVVELFTSQGCSSCPPADELLRSIATDPAAHGKVIPLAFHVDYWDGLGWRDPFSSRQWTERQVAYVRSFHIDSAYTPQAVVNGRRQMVGSSESALRAAIAEASNEPQASTVAVSFDDGNASVETNASRAGLDLLLLLTEDGVVTRVERGENGGRSLAGDAIVLQMIRGGEVARGHATGKVPLTIDVAKKRESVTVVALLQDPRTLRIEAASSVRMR